MAVGPEAKRIVLIEFDDGYDHTKDLGRWLQITALVRKPGHSDFENKVIRLNKDQQRELFDALTKEHGW